MNHMETSLENFQAVENHFFDLQTTCTVVAAPEATNNTSVKVHPNTTHGSSLTLSMPKMRKRQLKGPPP